MSYNLFLDDIRVPNEVGNYIYPHELKATYRLLNWTIVRDYDEFIKLIEEQGLPDLVSFDHDLADVHYDPATWTETFTYKEKTGLDCAKWLIEYCINNKLKLPKYLVHSMNPVGRENIQKLLTNFKNKQNGNEHLRE